MNATSTNSPPQPIGDGSRAIVTGGGAGIGRAIALRFAAMGMRVAVLDVDSAAATIVAEEVTRTGREGIPIAASVSDPQQVASAFSLVDQAWGGIDILVNCAGITANKPSLDLTIDDWRRTMQVNLDSVFYMSQEAGERMTVQGAGCIVNIGSIYSSVAAPNRLAYCASKAAVAMMTKVLAIE